LSGSTGDDAAAAASLVARFGSAEDANLLREFDRRPGSRSRKPGLASQLIRRVSPVVRVHDLGLSNYEVGERRVVLAETRRKSAALLLYLITRANLAATREQVLENLWPDQTPKSAMNSLHQTIFHLRRDIEPWFEDGTTAEYVHLEGELVRLDSGLFQVDSVAFARQAATIIAKGTASAEGPSMLSLYSGYFAPEFEYEEWASEWRSFLHTTYLRLAHATAGTLVSEGRHGEAVDVLGPVATLDPSAYDLRAVLVGCLAAVGATDAAQAQYRSLAALYERDLELPFRSYEEVIDPFRR
jgi:DNA-binding SARP family transcriptional activator